jgi:hypothetical protein
VVAVTVHEIVSRRWVISVALALAVGITLGAVVVSRHYAPVDVSGDPAMAGVPDDFQVLAEEAFAAYPEPFESVADGVAEQNNARKFAPLWLAAPTLSAGPQQTGDCVSWGLANALHVRQWVKVASGQRGDVVSPFPPYLYGISRVQSAGGKPPCGRAGAYPSFAISGLKQFGFVGIDEAGTAYNGRLADKWGCEGPPRALIDLARKRAGGDAYPIRSVEEWRDAHCNGFTCTVAIPWTPGETYQSNGRWCIRFNGRKLGAHQICSIGYDGSTGTPYFYLFNSHGADWPRGAAPMHGEPRGGVWVEQSAREPWAAWIIKNGEVWAINDVPGFTADELDLSIFDNLK